MIRRMIRPTCFLFLVLTLFTGLLYPLAITGLAQWLFLERANGSLLVVNGQVIGSRLIGQEFTDPRYFWGRPSATSEYPYNASQSGGSNLSVLNPVLMEAVRARLAKLKAADPGNNQAVPVDLVSSSASGLDPDISVAAARYQASRVARLRGLSLEEVLTLIDEHTQSRALGFLGEPRVNVLTLNLALDRLQ